MKKLFVLSLALASGGCFINVAVRDGGDSGDDATADSNPMDGSGPDGMVPGDAIVTDAPQPRMLYLAASGDHTCSIDLMHRVWCWGSNSHRESGSADNNAPVLTPFQVSTSANVVRVVLGQTHSAALNGFPPRVRAEFFGDGSHHELGTDLGPVNPPVDTLQQDINPTLTMGKSFSGYLEMGGRFHCWGDNQNGVCGPDMTTNPQFAPGVFVLPPGGMSFVAVTAGLSHVCALVSSSTVDRSGFAMCWGSSSFGQTGPMPMGSTPTQVSPKIYDLIVAGTNHTCAVLSDDVVCWGADGNGQIGRTGSATGGDPAPGCVDTTNAPDPASLEACATPVTVDMSADAPLALGDDFSCAIVSVDGARVLCWGGNAAGQLGASVTDGNPHPVPLSPTGYVTLVNTCRPSTVVAGNTHACVLCGPSSSNDEAGHVYCWGANNVGQIGAGDSVLASDTPLRVVF